jgi:hypothetical protein
MILKTRMPEIPVIFCLLHTYRIYINLQSHKRRGNQFLRHCSGSSFLPFLKQMPFTYALEAKAA